MALHLYGVVRAGTPSPEPPVAGRADATPFLVSDDELAVLVSEVDPDRPAGAQDLLAHARVLEAYVDQHAVVPMQFGLVLLEEADVHEQVLAADRESLLYLLDVFEGRVQLTVQASHREEQALREVLLRDPGLRQERDALEGATVADQGRQVALGQAVAEALEALEEEHRVELLDALGPYAEAVAENEAGAVHQVLNAAFLVLRDERAAFDEAVATVQEKYDQLLRIRYVGPQPPYSFLEAVRKGELVWG